MMHHVGACVYLREVFCFLMYMASYFIIKIIVTMSQNMKIHMFDKGNGVLIINDYYAKLDHLTLNKNF